MSYCIIRAAKLRNGGNVRAALEHNTRERPCEKADAARTPQNEILIGTKRADDALDEHARILAGLTAQKNAVRAIEYVVACPPDAIDRLDGPPGSRNGKYLREAVAWLSERHGGPHRVIHATIHRDEDSPHVHVIVVPVAERTRKGGHVHQVLSAKEYLGGKKKLAQLQTEYAEGVGKVWGLERGIPKAVTGRFHRPVRDWSPARVAAIEARALDGLSPEELKAIILAQRKQLQTAPSPGGQEKASTPPPSPTPPAREPRPSDPLEGQIWDNLNTQSKRFGPRTAALIKEYAQQWDNYPNPIRTKGVSDFYMLAESARRDAASEGRRATVADTEEILNQIDRVLDAQDKNRESGKEDPQRYRSHGQDRGRG